MSSSLPSWIGEFDDSDNSLMIVSKMRITVDLDVRLLQFTRLFTSRRVDVYKCKKVYVYCILKIIHILYVRYSYF